MYDPVETPGSNTYCGDTYIPAGPVAVHVEVCAGSTGAPAMPMSPINQETRI